jgi:hypothetical protein
MEGEKQITKEYPPVDKRDLFVQNLLREFENIAHQFLKDCLNI